MLSFLRLSPVKPARWSLVWLFFLLMALPRLAQAQCPSGDVTLSTQAQVNAFPPGCIRLNNSLTIRGNDITDLRPLSNLTDVNNSLIITANASLSTLSGLGNLYYVERDLLIDSNPVLTSIASLSALAQIGNRVNITDNTQLSQCAIAPICQFLANSPASVFISGNAAGCSSSAEVQDRCNPLAITTQPPSGSTVCAGATVTASISTTGNASSYQWYKGTQSLTGQKSATLTLTNVQPTDAGSYRVIVSNSVSSLTSTAFSLTVNPLPTVQGGGIDVCDNNTADLTQLARVDISGSALAYFNDFSATRPVANPSAVPAGNYYVQATSPAGCRSDRYQPGLIYVVGFSSTLTINNLSDSYCKNAAAVTLTGSPSGGSFTIDGQPATQLDPASLSVGNHTVRYTPQPAPCRPRFLEKTVEIKASPNATFTGLAGPYCADAAAITLTPNTSGGTFSGPGISGITLTPANAGTGGYVSYSVTVGGCSNTSQQSVVINPLPTVSISPSSTAICAGQTATLSATSDGGTYRWSGAQTTPTISVTASGTYSVTVTSPTGCTATASANVTLNALPSPAITGLGRSYCQSAAPVSLSGTPGGGQFTVDGVMSPSLTPASLSVGTHTVVYRYTNASGCSNTTSQSVTINATPNPPSLVTPSNQPGQLYPGGQSSVTVPQYSGVVSLTLSGCSGTVNWQGPEGSSGTTTSIPVSTSATGTFVYSATCQQPQTGCTSGVASATVVVQGAALTMVAPLYNCATRQLSLRTTGGNGLPIEYQIASVTTGWEPVGATFTVQDKHIGKSLKLRARQRSSPGGGYVEVETSFTPTACASGRVASPQAIESPLRVVVLGNPVTGTEVRFEVVGAEGQSLQVKLTDVSGRPVSERSLERAEALERQTLPVGNQKGGLLLLRVSTPSQSQTVKVLKAE